MKKKNQQKTKTNKTQRINVGVIPVGDRILVKLEKENTEKKNEFGIIIPDTVSKERPEQGKVIAVGEGKMNDSGELIPIRIKIGDQVIFSKYGYDEVKIEGEEYILVSESNILAVIK